MSYAVINAIMKMKIAVVAAKERQCGACRNEEEDSLLGECIRGLCRPPRLYILQLVASLKQICFTASLTLCSTASLPDICKLFSGWHNFPFLFLKRGRAPVLLRFCQSDSFAGH